MNETLVNILGRRSIRKYKEDQISDEELELILEAGKYAPSAMNEQSWHFTVIQNKETFERLKQALKAAFLKSGERRFESAAKSENFNPFYNAPTLILVFCDENAVVPQNDGSLALGNMFLAAQSLGVASCWIHAVNYLFSSEEGIELKKELAVPDGYVSVGSSVFGYNSGEVPSPLPRKDGTVNIIK